MKRFPLWLGFSIGGVIYAVIKVWLDVSTPRAALELAFDGTYWSGVTLFIHWAGNRLIAPSEAPRDDK